MVSALLLALFCLEIASHWILRREAVVGAEARSRALELMRTEAPWDAGNFLSELVPHPYFGFVLDPSHPSANNHGFDDPRPFPYLRGSSREFVIAVGGGSVAMGWARWIRGEGYPRFAELLKRRYPRLAKREIVVINLALGGFKQPQQFLAAAFFAESADLFLNLDGHNELFAHANFPKLPVEMPAGVFFLFDQQRRALAGKRALRALSRADQLLLRLAADGGFPNTPLSFLLLRSLHRLQASWVRDTVEAARDHWSRTEGKAFTLPPGQDSFAASLSAWGAFALKQQRLLEAMGRKAFFFLQPNQYLPGSKPLTEWERAHSVSRSYLYRSVMYSRLREAGAGWRRKGLKLVDLTQVYSKETREVYVDSCCHVNALGNAMLTEAIVAALPEKEF